ncbi:NADP-dependent phosphogluconate dehydrogenase [Paracoccus tegillarcae]|uniref:6-phosphogluconate dehydrogenase, decarboxylating n=1 Tax=Paracoccus tegillarcae TaxID=1529068 RepID=A0A2K9EEQ9_9RHOB|nr:NADP-dependent phosphogluconate dehydrogenase [Paracoccus tegillarcae]AUH33448.1 phosphogluconate dehydrogenase (NADP(+)-dependent, decarboxylating) [Paracoccus tegillarcae]
MGNADIGLIGLGTMGQALALNIAEKGFDIAVFNRTTAVTQDFAAEAGDLAARITPTESLEDLIAALKTPRMILLMVPAGKVVDQQIEALLPLLSPDDLLIDAGNSDFHDTNRRNAELPVQFLGIGVSGGEEGARHGPSIMGGGSRANWNRAAPILTAIAADYQGQPCADWMGEAGAGHFVKTVHNGIEYADMQLIAEVYGVMRDGLGMDAAAIAQVFERWNDGALKSYLVEITAKVAAAEDSATGGPVLDVIADIAGQKGTGRWTAIEAQHLGAPIPVIDAAVTARNISALKDRRTDLQEIFGPGPQPIAGQPDMDLLEQALTCGKILCYDQGFGMIAAASRDFGWSLNSAAIARVWRAGCIIRSAMLDDMAGALEDQPGRPLMAAPFFVDWLTKTQDALRRVVSLAVLHGIAVPAHSAALAYFDAMRTERGTANMLQGQRDYFGRHGFVRLDDGSEDQHGPWAG